ncbi:Low-specificity L-threonine aldolase [Caballeronia sordidicola]|uniref:Low-specificity L-threonine aldolase n=1 Tax=Caballeronia sordidicola TaxID=196367 RepID=A0A226X242_CABSO|nr:Low-specificity L-threonine aldolase [Caballeronia sordidicola]
MTTFSFLDDYSEGAHPDILRVLTESNFIQEAAYGDDAYSAEATARIKARLADSFEGAIYYVAGGTIANIVSISSCLRPHEAVIAANSGHIVVREAGAIEATGHKLITVPPSMASSHLSLSSPRLPAMLIFHTWLNPG